MRSIPAVLLAVIGLTCTAARAGTGQPAIEVRFWQDDYLTPLAAEDRDGIVRQVCARGKKKWEFLKWCPEAIARTGSEAACLGRDLAADSGKIIWCVKLDSQKRPPEQGRAAKRKIHLSHHLALSATDTMPRLEVPLNRSAELYDYHSPQPRSVEDRSKLLKVVTGTIDVQFEPQDEWQEANERLLAFPLTDKLVYDNVDPVWKYIIVPLRFCALSTSAPTRFKVVMAPTSPRARHNNEFFLTDDGPDPAGRLVKVEREGWSVTTNPPGSVKPNPDYPYWVEGLPGFQETNTRGTEVYLDEYHPDYAFSCSQE